MIFQVLNPLIKNQVGNKVIFYCVVTKHYTKTNSLHYNIMVTSKTSRPYQYVYICGDLHAACNRLYVKTLSQTCTTSESGGSLRSCLSAIKICLRNGRCDIVQSIVKILEAMSSMIQSMPWSRFSPVTALQPWISQ